MGDTFNEECHKFQEESCDTLEINLQSNFNFNVSKHCNSPSRRFMEVLKCCRMVTVDRNQQKQLENRYL